MRAETRSLGIAVLLAVALGGAGSVQAQESVLLRYRPRPGIALPTVVWTAMTMTIGELAAEGGEGVLTDTLSFEASTQHTVTERVVEAAGDRFVIHRSLDSARGRKRVMGAAWSDVPADIMPRARARVVLSERLQTVEFEPAGADSLDGLTADWLRNPGSGLEFVLPEERVTAGSVWQTEVVIPFYLGVVLEEEGAEFVERVELIAQTTVTLDSVVARGTDTLAYLGLRGTFLPLTITGAAEVAEGNATMTGAFAGRLIWSTGWSAFVSGATRAEIFMRLALSVADVAESDLGIRFDVTNRFQLRP
jgi:hypothetical protein